MAKKSKSKNTAASNKPLIPRWAVLVFLLVVVTAVLLVILVPWDAVSLWISTTASTIWDTLGWGLLFIVAAFVTFVVVVKTRNLISVFRHWHECLSVVAIVFAIWGILALVEQGGTFGQTIIGASTISAILRIFGILVAAIVLAFPVSSFRLIIRFFAWLASLMKRKSAPTPIIEEETEIHRPRELPATRSPKPETVKTPAVTLPVNNARNEMKQIAKDVWKKYGQSSSLKTVNGWHLPPIDILDENVDVEYGQTDNMQRAKLIEEALASYGVEAKVVQVNAGPTVTQFGVEPGWDRKTKDIKEKDKDGNITTRRQEISKTRVKVDRITSLANDLSLALAAPSIRIEAPVPGKSIVGIEVPNVVSSMVSLRSVIETSTFQKIAAKSGLSLALGKGAGGEAGASDLIKMPHLLIAGATGSGKTVCLNSTICCLLMHNTPNDVRLIMVDPKRVELTPYNSIPHLAIPVITDTDKALEALRWLNHEMDNRYKELARASARNIDAYNKNRQGRERMPYLVLVIDELADLMMTGFDEVEHILCRLAQLARATGIHLIVATQRPSVDVVTGLIKANFPTRISFAVTSQVDSRTILDGAGAEKLLGRGDMLFMPTEAAKPKRLQGCFVSDAETERLVYFWGSQSQHEVTKIEIQEPIQSPVTFRSREPNKDALLDAALQLAKEHDRISTSFLQRKLQIGYPRAARLKEQLEEELEKEAELPEEPEEDL